MKKLDESLLHLVEFNGMYIYAKISTTEPFEIDFNGDMMVQFELQDHKLIVINGMDGWGNSIKKEINGRELTVFNSVEL